MHLALEDPSAPWARLGAGYGAIRRGWLIDVAKIDARQIERSEDGRGAELVERHTADNLDHLAEEDEANVAVAGHCSRWSQERGAMGGLVHLASALG